MTDNDVTWAAVALDAATNRLIPCTSNSGVSTARIGSAVISLPEPGRDIRVCYAFGHIYGVVKGQNSGSAIVFRDDGLFKVLGPTHGNQCVGIIKDPNGSAGVMVANVTNLGKSWIQTILSADFGLSFTNQFSVPVDIEGTGQGFLGLTYNGYPVWTDLNRVTKLPNGVQLLLASKAGKYTVGQDLVSPGQISAFDGVSMFTVWVGDTQFPPQVAVDNDGMAMVGIAAHSVVFAVSPFGSYRVDPAPSPVPSPTPAPVPVPPSPTARFPFPGVPHMPDITGTIQHYGTNKVSGGRSTLTADPSTGEVWSVQPDGSLQRRLKGTAGGYEAGVQDGQLWSVRPFDKVYTFVLANVSGL